MIKYPRLGGGRHESAHSTTSLGSLTGCLSISLGLRLRCRQISPPLPSSPGKSHPPLLLQTIYML